MKLPTYTNRRTVVKALGTAAASGAVLTGTAVGCGGLASEIDSNGHYAYFPLGPDSWARSNDPFDIRQDDSRWTAEPNADGSVRCLVTNLPEDGNAGFDVHVGRLGGIREVRIDAETVRTARPEGAAVLFVGLYLDADDNGDFFAWDDCRGGTEAWEGFGRDSEGAVFPLADGEITIDRDTSFTLFHVGDGPGTATLCELQAGIDGFEGERIDGDTGAAVYVGAASAGRGTEEVVVDSLTVERA